MKCLIINWRQKCVGKNRRETERGKGVNERNSQSCRLFVPPAPTVAPRGISKGQQDAVTGEWAAVGVACVCVCDTERQRVHMLLASVEEVAAGVREMG